MWVRYEFGVEVGRVGASPVCCLLKLRKKWIARAEAQPSDHYSSRKMDYLSSRGSWWIVRI